MPSPRVHLGRVQIGSQEEVVIAGATIVFDATTLFSSPRVISSVQLDQPVIKKEAMALLTQVASQSSSTPASVEVRQVVLNDARLEWAELKTPSFNARIEIEQSHQLRTVLLDSVDGKLHIEARPQGQGYTANIRVTQWIPPVGPPLQFDRLDMDLVYAGNKLQAPRMEAQLYQGSLKGAAELDFAQDWRLDGKVFVNEVELGSATRLLTQKTKVSGRVSGEGSFGSRARDASGLVDALRTEFRFDVRKGVLYGLDLAKAATLLLRQGSSDGETRFDELSGVFSMRGKQMDFQQVRMSSGLLVARGNVRISQEKKLAGRVEVELKQSISMVAVPLDVSGSLDQPSVMPTKAALAGAAVGTGVLGPAGAALGVKAGSTLEKLFGNRK